MAHDTTKIRCDNPLTEVVEARGVKLTRDGQEWRGLCPFHNESTPSFTIYQGRHGTQEAHCFGCGWQGDVIAFVQEWEGISFPQACEHLGSQKAAGPAPERRQMPETADPYAEWKAIMPPPDAPAFEPGKRTAPLFNPKRDNSCTYTPTLVHAYRKATGEVYGYVLRVDIGGKKLTPLLLWCRNTKTKQQGWCHRPMAEPRRPYRLNDLSARPKAQVLIVEGEKTADAAARLLPNLVVISWQGGGKAVEKTDWRHLRDRDVIVWPDADAEGDVAADTVCRLAAEAGAQQVRRATRAMPRIDGWDLANAEEEGWTKADVLAFVKAQMRPWGAPAKSAPRQPEPEPERPAPLPKPTLRPQRQEKEEPAEEEKPSNVVPLPKPKQRRITDDEPDPLAELRQHVVYEKGDWGDKPVPKNARNFTAYVQYHPDARDRLRLNLFTNQITVTRAMPWGRGDAARALDDRDVREAKLWLWHAGLKPSTAEAHEAMTVAAERNAFDPVREHLEGLPWDGVPRLRTWLTKYMGVRASNTKVEEAFGMRWFVSGVARILAGPQGAKVDTVLVLEGSQGLGKSQALRIIATMRGVEYFLDDLGDIAGKDALLQLAGQVIVELAELKTINRSSVDAVKEFLSKKDDTYRAPYERVAKKHARRCIFAATVNPTGGYLKDPTGARRFWPVNIEGEIDLAGLERDRDQLWAEAVALYRAGEKWWLQGEEVQHAEAVQALRYQDDVWSDVIDAFMAKGGDYTVSQILHLACGVVTDRQGAREKDRVEAHLKARGFRRRRTQRDGENVYVYGRAKK